MANIQRSMGGLNATHKLLFGSLAVIAAMTLFLVSQYAKRPAMVDFMAVASADAGAVTTLRNAGIPAEVVDGRVMVPAGREHEAMAQLSERGQLPGDTTILFNNLIQSQDWKASREQHRQQEVIALQNELARVIARFRGVRRATVLLHAPDPSGLGRAVQEPTASVSVETTGGALSQQTVDAIASLVAGARAGLKTTNVAVIDATTGRELRASDEESASAGRYLEHKMQVERYTQREIERLLAHVPGAIVSVNAVVDVTRVNSTRQRYLPKDQGSVSIASRVETSEETSTSGSRAAEPGARAWGTADINAGSGSSGPESAIATEQSEFTVQIGSETTMVVDPRGMPTHLSATVVIPQGYVEELVRRSRPDGQADAPVTFQEAQAYFDSMRPMLERSILTRLETVDPDGQVRSGRVELAMVPTPSGSAPTLTQAGFFGFGAASTGAVAGGRLATASGLVETVVLGVLGLMALVLMFTMVRRAGRRTELPTAEELVGVPPALEIAGDLVGEADESDAAMQGIEITEEEVKVQKMRELVGDLINTNPEAAASLVGRWISEDE